MNNFELKKESAQFFQTILTVWSIIKKVKLESIEKPLKEWFSIDWEIVKKDSEDYNFLQNILKKTVKNVSESSFSDNIKKNWLNIYKYENINLKNYLKIIEILKKEPFLWEKSYFNYDFSKINKENFLDEIEEIHFEIVDKMYEELYK